MAFEDPTIVKLLLGNRKKFEIIIVGDGVERGFFLS